MIDYSDEDLLADVEAERRFARDIVASRAEDLSPASYRRVAAEIMAAGADFDNAGAIWTAEAVARLLREEACCVDQEQPAS